MPPSIANMYGCYIVAFALQGITRCGAFAAKAMPISNIDDPGKVPYYLIGPTKINQMLVATGWSASDQILTHVSGHTIRIIADAFAKSELQSPFTV